MSGTVDPKRVFKDPKVVSLAKEAQRGNIEGVRRLLGEGVSPRTRGDREITPLTFALLAPTVGPLRLILQAGADPNIVQTDGVVPLYYTLVKDDTSFLQIMLENRADPNAVMPNGSVLEEALMLGNLPAMQMLLARGADPNRKSHGNPLLHTALEVNLPQAARLLIQAKADPLATDKRGTNFLKYVCDSARKFLKHGPGVEAYHEYVRLWKELAALKHTPPCKQPF